jgi:radical SAM superfamily enzyme YgiQ (UPF0313 family)
MKVLLLTPPVDLKSSYGKLKDFSNPQPSIGLAYIAAVLRRGGHEVSIIDAYVNQFSLREILDKIKAEAPQIVGISVLTTSSDTVRIISLGIRSFIPQAKIVYGNIHATLFCDDLLKSGQADYIVHREGEMTMLDLVNTLAAGKPIGDVLGISFLDKGAVINTPSRPFIEALDVLPYPAWDLLPMEKYTSDPRTELLPNQNTFQILATRGCPNICTFCSSHTDKSLGMIYRMRDPKKVVDEMEYLYHCFGARAFTFMDLAFPLIKNHGMELCQEIINRGLHEKIRWTSELRVKPLDEEILYKMKEAGCKTINFGIESGTDRILGLLKKNFTADDVRRAVKMAHKAGLETDGMFMIGLPEETEDDIKRTIDFAIELGMRYSIFNIFVPYPGCELYDVLSKQNKIHFKHWSDFISYPTYSGGVPVYVPDGLTKAQLMSLQTLAMKKFYLRPEFIKRELSELKWNKLKYYWSGFWSVVKTKI